MDQKTKIYSFGDVGYYLPRFIESRTNEWVSFGEKNDWPELMVRLYNQSAMNRTCIVSKYDSVIGKGLKCRTHEDLKANRKQTLNDVFERCTLDYIIHGGFCLNVVWNLLGTQAEVYHVDFTKVRSGKPDKHTGEVNEYYFCSDWMTYRRCGVEKVCRFDPSKSKEYPNQLYYSKDYNPGTDIYPLSDYIGSINDILSDIQVSIFHNANLQNGLIPSLWISFRDGIPDPTEQTSIYNNIADSFSGADKAGKFFLSFADSPDSTPEVTPLRAENDQYYITLDTRIVNRILTSHRITSPLLLGIRDSSGGLGSNKDEILTAYAHFISTVVKPIQKYLLKEFNYIVETTKGIQVDLYIEPRSLFEEDVAEKTTESALVPVTPTETNEALRSLSGRQFQGLLRIVRQYEQEKITLEQAKTMLSSGFGLSESQIQSFLGLDDETKPINSIS